MRKTPTFAACAVLSTLLLASCGSAPSVQCPEPPRKPEPPALVPLGPSFQDEMRSFLRGLLPEPTNSGQSLAPASSASSPAR